MGANSRLKYSEELCSNHYKNFSTRDLAYICSWYGQISSREIAIALGRTQDAILRKVSKLKTSGEFEHYKKLELKYSSR